MPTEYNFHIEQVEVIRQVMLDLADYRPDGKTPVQIATLITSAETARDTYRDKKTDLELCRGGIDLAVGEAHDLCVRIYGIMTSVYRSDAKSRSAMDKLPVEDQSREETMERGEAILK